MDIFSQTDRPLRFHCPLGGDVLLAFALRGREAVSEPFRFDVKLLARIDSDVAFDRVVGRPAGITMQTPEGGTRHLHGIVEQFSSTGASDQFAYYEARLVPALHLLNRNRRCRIFQRLTAVDILAELFDGLDVSMRLSGCYPACDYCVQYNESDFHFASRLMEEEGIFYFFEHGPDRHNLVLADETNRLEPIPEPQTLLYEPVEGGLREEPRVWKWRKTQTVVAESVTLWDHAFQLPGEHLEGRASIPPQADCGRTTHQLQCGEPPAEVFEYPGGYAERYDDVGPGAGPAPGEMSQVFDDSTRTAGLRAERLACQSLRIEAESNCPNVVPGHLLGLSRHGEADGRYLVLAAEHEAELQLDYRSDGRIETDGLKYSNRLHGLPESLPYRPPRRTPAPVISGVQTATVVGPPGEEIYVDKYGRVKVQFHWDQRSGSGVDSSCWIRVAQFWAGRRWGAFFWPRVGHEVIVAFAEGDPDQPVVVGSVYNADNMPPLSLPSQATRGGIKSCIFGGNPLMNFNAVVFHDAMGHEYVQIHSEKREMYNSEQHKYHYVPGRHYDFHGHMF